MLELNLHASRGALSFEIHLHARQPWTVLFGTSGSGKSSILRAIAGLWQPASTRVVLADQDISALPPHRRRIALVTHHAALLPHKTAIQNVLFPLSSSHEKNSAEELLQRFHVAHVQDRKPHRLSGGEQQRVALARAIASNPRVLLLDEALSGLDLTLRSEILLELKTWQAKTGALILSVTHNLSETLESADEVMLLDEGRIVRSGTAREVLSDRREHLLKLLTD
jgi:ABC-type Fe3+/spermidine/putrescine transport system ATPase subunit